MFNILLLISLLFNNPKKVILGTWTGQMNNRSLKIHLCSQIYNSKAIQNSNYQSKLGAHQINLT